MDKTPEEVEKIIELLINEKNCSVFFDDMPNKEDPERIKENLVGRLPIGKNKRGSVVYLDINANG